MRRAFAFVIGLTLISALPPRASAMELTNVDRQFLLDHAYSANDVKLFDLTRIAPTQEVFDEWARCKSVLTNGALSKGATAGQSDAFTDSFCGEQPKAFIATDRTGETVIMFGFKNGLPPIKLKPEFNGHLGKGAVVTFSAFSGPSGASHELAMRNIPINVAGSTIILPVSNRTQVTPWNWIRFENEVGFYLPGFPELYSELDRCRATLPAMETSK